MSKIFFLIKKENFSFFEDYLNSINTKLFGINITYEDHIPMQIDEIKEKIRDPENIIIFLYKLPNFLINSNNQTDTNIENYNSNNNIFFLNTEQLSQVHNLNYIINNIYKKFHLIDYSRVNIDILKNKLIDQVIYFPYIYNQKEIYDIPKVKNYCAITLSNTRKREKLFTSLKEKNIEVDNIWGWGKSRDMCLFSYKILINISAHDDFNVFETFRCYRCIFNKMIIISDIKYKIELVEHTRHVLFAETENIPGLINDVLSNYDKYYKMLDLDNIDYHINDHLISSDILYNYKNNIKYSN